MRLKFSIFFVFSAIIFSSCKKELSISPTDTFNETNAFLTIADVQLGTNAVYARYGTYSNDMYVSALLSDEAKLGVDNSGQGALTYRYQYNSDPTTGGDVIAAYYGYYSMIDQANRVLAKAPTVTATAAEEPRRNILTGQLLAMRALGHFGLLRNYSDRYNPSGVGVPIMLESNPLARPARSTMGEVMAQIQKDLTDAKALLPAVTAATFSDTVMNQMNITAFQARIALYRGDYQQAIDFATTVINSNVKPLSSGAAFQSIWTDGTNNETLFRIRYATSSAIGSIFTTTGGLVYIAPSDKLIALYSANDVRKAAYIGTTGGKNYVNKFYVSSRGGRVVDLKAARIAEMYLIRAEANAKLGGAGNVTAGATDLNTLRAARITGYTAQTYTSAATLLSDVLTERLKELCFEGFRFYDLKRNNLPVDRLASDASAAWQTLPATSNLFTLPIPRDELNANPNTTQNPGY